MVVPILAQQGLEQRRNGRQVRKSVLSMGRCIILSMPELPEVETVARDLRPLLVGRTLGKVQIGNRALRRPWSKGWGKKIVGREFAAIDRRGKWLILELNDGGFLLVHLGMTGQLTVVPPDTPATDHTHLVFPLDNGDELRFRDIRRFGSATYYPNRKGWEEFLSDKLGPEPWDMPSGDWYAGLQSSRRSLKALLLDQTFVAGVGNIYADESCFAAGLDPRRMGSRLEPAEALRLLSSIQSVLTRAIESRGSSIRNYVGGSGLQGEFQDEFCVYGRTGHPCPTCAEPIQCIRLAGRSTHFCGCCQR